MLKKVLDVKRVSDGELLEVEGVMLNVVRSYDLTLEEKEKLWMKMDERIQGMSVWRLEQTHETGEDEVHG